MQAESYDIIIAGGGAAGFFSAINIAEKNPKLRILILEKSKKFLDKVRISGGGRCNVTHACWEPKELIQYYPRGQRELLGPFHKFMCGDMLAWLDEKGVETSIEEDGRVFPASNKSSTIIDCFLALVEKLNIETRLSVGLKEFEKIDGHFVCSTSLSEKLLCKHLIITTGGSPSMWKMLQTKNIKIVPAIPSLFTFNIKSRILNDLPGLSVENAQIRIEGFNMQTSGPVLITHWGLSGPGILKLSSWGARWLYDKKYEFKIYINWLSKSMEETETILRDHKARSGADKVLSDHKLFNLPKRLWRALISSEKLHYKNWADLTKEEITKLVLRLCESPFQVNGKSTNKDEFVTSGGVSLEEINFSKMESKKIPNLFFAGEILDIDALTGGFNFQAAWTSSWLIAQNVF